MTLNRPDPVTGGWPIVADGVVDPKAYCQPPKGCNLAMLPNEGGRRYMAGKVAWELWCAIYCRCERHEAGRREAIEMAKATAKENDK